MRRQIGSDAVMPPQSLARQSLGPFFGSVLKFWIERKVPLVPLPILGQTRNARSENVERGVTSHGKAK